MDFFAGSGTTGHATLLANAKDNGNRRFVLVQFPESTGETTYPTISDLTKERLRRAGKKIQNENSMFAGDVGFRVFKLASSNIRAWEPNRDDIPQTLQDSIVHLKADRTEQDILFELLVKLGLDLTIPVEQKIIAGKIVHNIGAGALLVCLADRISATEVEALALGIAAWHKELAPAGETTVVFRDSAFADDVAKTNLSAILQQNGLKNIRSL
jgi:adenine-specific DNA-methyltransferase